MREVKLFMTKEDAEQTVEEAKLNKYVEHKHFTDEDGDLAHMVKQEDMDRFMRRQQWKRYS